MGSDSDKRERGSVDRELYCKLLERLLLGSAAELGHHGNMGQVVAAIERGGAGGSTANPDLAMLARIGWKQGVHDGYDRERAPVYRLEQLRELGVAWELLAPGQQETALAHYLGSPRAPETLRAHFGEFAGVVLHRWLRRKAKERARNAGAGTAKALAELERVRAELAGIEREFAALAATQPTPPLRPERPSIPLVLSKRARKEERAPYRAARAAYLEAMQTHTAIAEGWLAGFEFRTLELGLHAKPLEAEQARLCAVLAALHAGGDAQADELELVEACGTGGERKKRADLLPGGENDLTTRAEADVRALHRAWRTARRKAARAWVDADGAEPEPEPEAEAAAG